MLFALLAAFLFACSGVSAQRTSRMIGPMKANALRLGFAAIVLALWNWHSGAVDWTSVAAQRLFASGALGFGVGDMALFFAFPRIGARQTLLINLCTAPVFGLIGDRLLLGTPVIAWQVVCCALILLGVSQAVMGKGTSQQVSGSRTVGLCAALVAGFGQGSGSVLSRWSHLAQSTSGMVLPSAAETLLRVVPGFIVVALLWLIVRKMRVQAPWAQEHPLTRKASAWVIANACFGAIFGVTCFQHALLDASSAVVLSITATAPVMVMPLTFYSERDVPSVRSVLGALVAIAGVVLLRSVT